MERQQEQNRRQFVRTQFRAEINVMHESLGVVSVHTADISDGGVYVLSEGKLVLNMGDIVDVQVQSMPGGEAPVVTMKVVRVDPDGVGLSFV